ncbi:hypothetical protein RUM44_000263 [Polyplax serrata]|uniref:Uncharacterized protein n=1 Tax=Polyplax serrata TaxID=468196 RepID=A0ABR1B4Z9_POLSC
MKLMNAFGGRRNPNGDNRTFKNPKNLDVEEESQNYRTELQTGNPDEDSFPSSMAELSGVHKDADVKKALSTFQGCHHQCGSPLSRRPFQADVKIGDFPGLSEQLDGSSNSSRKDKLFHPEKKKVKMMGNAEKARDTVSNLRPSDNQTKRWF